MPKKKILIIDDEPQLVESLKVRIEANGFECVTASSPEDGIKLAPVLRPDLILLDLNMPHMSGYGVLRELKQNPDLAGIPVLILSSLTDEEVVRGALEFGATGFLKKTCSPEELMTMVTEYAAPAAL